MAKFYGFAVSGTEEFPEETPMAFTPVVWEPPGSPNEFHSATGDGGVTTGHAAGLTNDLIYYAADGSANRLHRAVSRHALVGAGTITLKAYWGGGNDYIAFGLDPSSTPIGLADIDHRVFDLYAGPSDSDTIVLSRDGGGNVTVTRNGGAPTTLGGVASLPLYLHVFQNNTAASGVRCAVITGSTNDTATPTAAPTLSVTSGHKRNHLAITFPSGANGVSIYRSTASGGQDFTQPIVTEWRYPYYDDIELTNGTTYYYRAKATIDGLAHSAASNQVAEAPIADQIPALSDDVAWLIGSPEVKPIDYDSPVSYWYERINEYEGLSKGLGMPNRHPLTVANAAGTVSITNGSTTVTGSGTAFLTEYVHSGCRADTYIYIVNGGTTYTHKIRWVVSDTQLTLWTAATADASGLSHRAASPPNVVVDPVVGLNQTQAFWDTHFYDLPLSMYAAYYRTGNLFYRDMARHAASVWLDFSIAKEADADPGQRYMAPLYQNNAGGCLWYLDQNDSDFIDWLKRMADALEATWLSNRIAMGESSPTYFRGVRYEAYMGQSCLFLGKFHPTQAVREDYEWHGIEALTKYFHWQMNRYAVSPHATDVTPRNPNMLNNSETVRWYHYHQPFLNAIYGELAVMGHKHCLARYVETSDAAFSTAATTIETDYLAWVARCEVDWCDKEITHIDLPSGTHLNCVYYDLYHSTEATTEPLDIPPYSDAMDLYIDGTNWQAMGITSVSEPSPVAIAGLGDGLPAIRMPTCMTLTQYGYAYYLTGDTDYLTYGDRRLVSTFGNSSGALDAGHVISEVRAKAGWMFNEAYRRAHTYLAYRDVIAPVGP